MKGAHQFGNCGCCGYCAQIVEDWEDGVIGDQWEIISGDPEIVGVLDWWGNYPKMLRMSDSHTLMVWHPNYVPEDPESEPRAIRIHIKPHGLSMADGNQGGGVSTGLRIIFNYEDEDNYYFVQYYRDSGGNPRIGGGQIIIGRRESGTDTTIVTSSFTQFDHGSIQIFLGQLSEGFTGIYLVNPHNRYFAVAQVPFLNTKLAIGTGDISHYSPAQIDINQIDVEYYYGSGDAECFPEHYRCYAQYGRPEVEIVSGAWTSPPGGGRRTHDPGALIVYKSIDPALTDRVSITGCNVFGYQDPDNYYYFGIEAYDPRDRLFPYVVKLYKVEGGVTSLALERNLSGTQYGAPGNVICVQGNRLSYGGRDLAGYRGGPVILYDMPPGAFGYRAPDPIIGDGVTVIPIASVQWSDKYQDCQFCGEPCSKCLPGTTPRQMQLDLVRTKDGISTEYSYLCDLMFGFINCSYRSPELPDGTYWGVSLTDDEIHVGKPWPSPSGIHPLTTPIDGLNFSTSFSYVLPNEVWDGFVVAGPIYYDATVTAIP